MSSLTKALEYEKVTFKQLKSVLGTDRLARGQRWVSSSVKLELTHSSIPPARKPQGWVLLSRKDPCGRKEPTP